jgi:hypothetical protein
MNRYRVLIIEEDYEPTKKAQASPRCPDEPPNVEVIRKFSDPTNGNVQGYEDFLYCDLCGPSIASTGYAYYNPLDRMCIHHAAWHAQCGRTLFPQSSGQDGAPVRVALNGSHEPFKADKPVKKTK